ncbi:hypothetical protein BaRGS_00007323, partial [Batillaria attramentaria]
MEFGKRTIVQGLFYAFLSKRKSKSKVSRVAREPPVSLRGCDRNTAAANTTEFSRPFSLAVV